MKKNKMFWFATTGCVAVIAATVMVAWPLSNIDINDAHAETSSTAEQHSHGQHALHPENFSIVNPASFEEAVGNAQLIVEGNVVENLTPYSIDDNIVKEDPFISKVQEKMKKNNLGELKIPKVIPTKLKITNTLKGDALTNEITIIQSEIFDGFDPKLKKGDNYVFFMVKAPQPNTYVATHYQAGYYQIDEKNKIKSLYSNGQFGSINGLDLNDFKAKVTNAIKK